jgi:molybdopterin/thiamine biosynthesis adenylyltransferase
MAAIRPETEVDRTEAALATEGASLPLEHGAVAIKVAPEAVTSPVGQKLLVVLVNELARMKGVVRSIIVDGVAGIEVQPSVPLGGLVLDDGLSSLVSALNASGSEYKATVEFGHAPQAAIRVGIGTSQADVTVGADGWRALLGSYVAAADWASPCPYGAALAASLAATEVFKRLLIANGHGEQQSKLISDFAFSAYNYGINADAIAGPALHQLTVSDFAVVGCGAGGTAALYVLAMQPGLSGIISLIEPGSHKLSNLNRYLMTTATDVHEARHKLATVVNHLGHFAPGLDLRVHPRSWEMLAAHPWSLLLSTVDTVPARWQIQRRAKAGAEILDAAVLDLLYVVARVTPGGRCLECIHPFDADYEYMRRAATWGVDKEEMRSWTKFNVDVTEAMVVTLARTQNKHSDEYAELVGLPFDKVPSLTECGQTKLRTDVPSQAPTLPLTTTPAGTILAAEIVKHFVAPDAQLSNWLGHHLRRAPGSPTIKLRAPRVGCPHHD